MLTNQGHTPYYVNIARNLNRYPQRVPRNYEGPGIMSRMTQRFRLVSAHPYRLHAQRLVVSSLERRARAIACYLSYYNRCHKRNLRT